MTGGGRPADRPVIENDGRGEVVLGRPGHLHVVRVGQPAVLREHIPADVGGGHGRVRGSSLRGGQIEPAPVDPEVVPFFFENRLVLGADGHHLESGHDVAAPDDLFVRRVDAQSGRGAEIEREGMGLAVRRADRGRDVSHGPRHDVEVLDEQGRGEGQDQLDAGIGERVNGLSGSDRKIGLAEGRDLPGAWPHHPVGSPIDAGQRREPVNGSRPMAGPVVCQLVFDGPDAEIGIVRHERDRRGARGRGACGRGPRDARKGPDDGERQQAPEPFFLHDISLLGMNHGWNYGDI